MTKTDEKPADHIEIPELFGPAANPVAVSPILM
jgi:hypothetical protein